MTSTPDLSHAISMHPHPFLPQTNSYSSDQIHRSAGMATSTAVEAITASAEDHDTISRHTTAGQSDVEGQRPSRHTLESDPYSLSSRIMSPEAMRQIRVKTSKKRGGFVPATLKKNSRKARKIHS